MKRTILLYGTLMAICVTIYKFIEFQFISKSLSIELTISLFAILFTLIGIWAGLKFGGNSPKEVFFKSNPQKAEDLNISKRETEVLELLAEGLSNQEIADKLFVSLNTIKTHSSNLYSKLDVKRRIQAIERARSLGILEAHTIE